MAEKKRENLEKYVIREFGRVKLSKTLNFLLGKTTSNIKRK